MFEQELEVIRKTEADADGLVKQAGADAKKILADSRAEADRILEQARADAQDTIQISLSEGGTIADQHYANAMDSAETKKNDLMREAESRIDAASDRIMERIVTSVNR